MSFYQIAVFLAIVLIYRLILNNRFKKLFIFVLSIIVLYWLQSPLILRNWSYWLPLISILLVLSCWVIVTPKSKLFLKHNIINFILLISIIITITALGNLLKGFPILRTSPLQLSQVLPLLFIAFLLLLLLSIEEKYKLYYSYLLFIVIIAIFIVYKTPSLLTKVAYLSQYISGGTALINIDELRWLGFSYLAFRLLHVIRDKQTGHYISIDLDRFVSYAIFFPAVTAGPIDRIEHFDREMEEEKDRISGLINGIRRIIIGLLNKFVIADSLSIISLNSINALQSTSTFWLWVHLIGYSLQIYFDFSGYTDIAIGISNCLGIKLPENFKKPFSAPNLTQFWNRWHMSLTQWFRAYFFNPVNRYLKSKQKSIPSTLVLFTTQVCTMILIGLWHGISTNFIIWGLWHGFGLFIQNRWSAVIQPIIENFHPPATVLTSMKYLSVFITIVYITVGWIWFAINDTNTSWFVLQKLFGVLK